MIVNLERAGGALVKEGQRYIDGLWGRKQGWAFHFMSNNSFGAWVGVGVWLLCENGGSIENGSWI